MSAASKSAVENMEEDVTDNLLMETDVVFNRNRNRSCQTRTAKWLAIEQIYEKLHRPNFYNIGHTYLNDVLDFTFTAKVENVGSIFVLHIFLSNRYEAFVMISINEGSDLKIDRKNGKAFLSSISREHAFVVNPIPPIPYEGTPHYVTSYSFSELDVELLKDKKLYIAFSYVESKGLRQEVIDDVKFSHDFGAILTESIGCDFKIKSADGTSFQVHKAMLAVHSNVFRAMLKEDTAESQNNFVELNDVSKEDLSSMLEFIYTGTLKDLNNTNWYNLLMLSDKYDLNGLRVLCQHALTQQLARDNVLELLIAADMYNTDELKTACLKFIKKNIPVLKESTFKEIKDVNLMRELCEYLAH